MDPPKIQKKKKQGHIKSELWIHRCSNEYPIHKSQDIRPITSPYPIPKGGDGRCPPQKAVPAAADHKN